MVPNMGALQRRRKLMWLMLSVLAALLGYFGLRGYLSPELLFHFANSLYC
jgi:cytochrome c oxidase subunit IV